jgi:hypothetical protein
VAASDDPARIAEAMLEGLSDDGLYRAAQRINVG